MAKTRHSRLGFSLTEFAIVMGVISIIVGSIWVLAAQAWENIRREQLREAIALTVNKARDFYLGQPGVLDKGTSGPTETPALSSFWIAQGIIPPTLTRGPITPGVGSPASCTNPAEPTLKLCADQPWGSTVPAGVSSMGTFSVCDWTMGAGCGAAPVGGYSQYFGIAVAGLSNGACIDAAESVSGPSGPPGLADVNINNCNIISGTGCAGYVLTPSLPVSVNDANALCNKGPLGNIVSFAFRLSLPPS